MDPTEGLEAVTSRTDFVEDILKAVARMETDELRLASCMCQVIAATPEQLDRIQELLGPAETKEDRIIRKLGQLVRVEKTSDGMWHAFLHKHGSWADREGAKYAAQDLRALIEKAVREA